MSDEDAFLRTILTDPGDAAVRLVYADWLEEQGDQRGEYLRLSGTYANLLMNEPPALTGQDPPTYRTRRAEWLKRKWLTRARLRELCKTVPDDWVALVHQGPIRRFTDPGSLCNHEDCPGLWE